MPEWLNVIFQNIVNYSVYLAIIVLFIICIFKCILPVLANTGALNRAIRAMKNDKGKTVHRKTWENESFLGNGGMEPAWRLYLENVFFADSHMQAPCSVEDYVNDESVISIPGRSSLADAVPSIFVSLGFLGTLIGLVQGLAGMSLGNSVEISESMFQVIGSLRYAFGTSIAGVIASILFLICNKFAQGRAGDTLAQFIQIFQQDTDMPPVDPITQIATYQQEQTRALDTLLAEVQGHFSERLNASIAAQLQPMRASMESFMNAASYKQVEGVERIVNTFVSHMDASLRGQFSHLAQVMDDTCRYQQRANESMTGALKGFGSIASDITAVQQASGMVVEKFDRYLSSLNSAQEKQDGRSDMLTAQFDAMQKIAREQARYINQLQDYLIKLQKSLDSYATQSDRFLAQYTQVNANSQQLMQDASKAMLASADTLKQASDVQVKGLETNLAGMLHTMDETLREVTKQFSWTISNMQKTVDSLPGIMQGSADGYAQQMARFVESVRRLQQALDYAMGEPARNGDYEPPLTAQHGPGYGPKSAAPSRGNGYAPGPGQDDYRRRID